MGGSVGNQLERSLTKFWNRTWLFFNGKIKNKFQDGLSITIKYINSTISNVLDEYVRSDPVKNVRFNKKIQLFWTGAHDSHTRLKY